MPTIAGIARSQRLGYPTDSMLVLKSLDGKQNFAIPDDTAETVSPKGFYTASQDPQAFRFVGLQCPDAAL